MTSRVIVVFLERRLRRLMFQGRLSSDLGTLITGGVCVKGFASTTHVCCENRGVFFVVVWSS
jgi:hypothetical protein